MCPDYSVTHVPGSDSAFTSPCLRGELTVFAALRRFATLSPQAGRG
jgi:hypothetical protein